MKTKEGIRWDEGEKMQILNIKSNRRSKVKCDRLMTYKRITGISYRRSNKDINEWFNSKLRTNLSTMNHS